MNGYLLINKPRGITSHDAVMSIRKAAKIKKVGHTGTLDPIAEGLMIICLGKCTKVSSYISSADKGYIAEMKLGTDSDTYDITGNLSPFPNFSITDYSESLIKDTLMSFIGKQNQLPPMYSAKKVGGKKLYELAREGKTVEIKPCEIEIYDIKILDIDGENVKFYVCCSKGTYIRSLIHDFGIKLGCGAVMSALKRTKTSGFDVKTAKVYELSELETSYQVEKALLPPDYIFRNCKSAVLNPLCERILKNGVPINIYRAGIPNIYKNGEYVRIYNENNDFLALCRIFDDILMKLEITFFDN